MMKNKTILSEIIEIKETKNLKEVAQMLSSGAWIALCATKEEPYCFCMGRVKCLDDQ